MYRNCSFCSPFTFPGADGSAHISHILKPSVFRQQISSFYHRNTRSCNLYYMKSMWLLLSGYCSCLAQTVTCGFLRNGNDTKMPRIREYEHLRIRDVFFAGRQPAFAASLILNFLEFQISTFHRACRMLAEHTEHTALVAELSRLPVFLSLGKDRVDLLRSLSFALDTDDV